MRLHKIPLSIVSNKDPKFTSQFWQSLQRAMGTQLNFSTAFHPQIDGQSERVIQILEPMSWILKGIEQTIYPWQNLLTTIVTMLVLAWRLMKHFMEDPVDHPCVGKNWVRVAYWDLRLSKRLQKRYRSSKGNSRLPKIDRKVMQTKGEERWSLKKKIGSL